MESRLGNCRKILVKSRQETKVTSHDKTWQYMSSLLSIRRLHSHFCNSCLHAKNDPRYAETCHILDSHKLHRPTADSGTVQK